ncbi:MAG: hypothetical protein K2K94_06600 [Muribaculaceae bacterium]|nr:hypothetical protein [Muribaculaceae bacterium]
MGHQIVAWGGAQRDPMKAEADKRDAQSAVARKPDTEPLATTLTWVSPFLTQHLGSRCAPPKAIFSRLALRV